MGRKMDLIEVKLTEQIIGAAVEVHKTLGPGLLESAYQIYLAHELTIRNIPLETEKDLPIEYKGVKLDCGYRLDFLIDKKVIIEVKAVQSLESIHEAQLLTSMKLTGIRVGLLLNFCEEILTKGMKRIVL